MTRCSVFLHLNRRFTTRAAPFFLRKHIAMLERAFGVVAAAAEAAEVPLIADTATTARVAHATLRRAGRGITSVLGMGVRFRCD